MSFNIITPEGEKGFLVPDGGAEGQVLKKTAEGFEWGSALDTKAAITLDKHTDGLIYIFIDGVKVGNGVEVTGEVVEGDVVGTVDENNNLLLSGSLADGTYKVRYVTENGIYSDPITMVVSSIVTYAVTNNLTECSTDNFATSVTKGASYSATILANKGYELSSITVKMGGTDITSTVVSGETINIASVTGDIVITAVAEEIVLPSYTNILTSGDYPVELNKRWSASGKAYTACNGMIGIKIPKADVLDKTIYFKGFTKDLQSSSQPALWFSLGSDNTRIAALRGGTTGSGNGAMWETSYLTDEGNGVYSIPINTTTFGTLDSVTTFVFNMAVNASAAVTSLDGLIMTIDEPIV